MARESRNGMAPETTKARRPFQSTLDRAVKLLSGHAFLTGLAIRLFVMVAMPMLLDDGLLLRGVRYTDIDYDVFSQAAEHVANGRSPFNRHTYRYTPFLAVLLALPLRAGDEGRAIGAEGWFRHRQYFGKFLFCIADAICGYAILALRRKARALDGGKGDVNPAEGSRKNDRGEGETGGAFIVPIELQDALWWLYNPLPINICTRGSAESLVVLLPVLMTAAISTRPSMNDEPRGRWSVIQRAGLAGIIHGISVHSKLYPVIYTVSYMANFSLQEHRAAQEMKSCSARSEDGESNFWGWTKTLPPLKGTQNEAQPEGNEYVQPSSGNTFTAPKSYPFPWTRPRRFIRLVFLWIRRLFFATSPAVFLLSSISTFTLLTFLAVHYYGRKALDEGLLYHFSRVDHRHNYSMYWYWIYLARGKGASKVAEAVKERGFTSMVSSTTSMSSLGRALLIPQAILLAYSSLGLAPYDLTFALFVQTFLFVANNKVITAQYFTWYLCLLPLCSDRIKWRTRGMFDSLAGLAATIIAWLRVAYGLEMQGDARHKQLWFISLLFFTANVAVLKSILNGYGEHGIWETNVKDGSLSGGAGATTIAMDSSVEKKKKQ